MIKSVMPNKLLPNMILQKNNQTKISQATARYKIQSKMRKVKLDSKKPKWFKVIKPPENQFFILSKKNWKIESYNIR